MRPFEAKVVTGGHGTGTATRGQLGEIGHGGRFRWVTLGPRHCTWAHTRDTRGYVDGAAGTKSSTLVPLHVATKQTIKREHG